MFNARPRPDTSKAKAMATLLPYETNYIKTSDVTTDILSRAVSELSQLIVQILDSAFMSPFLGLRNNVRCSYWAHWKARSGLPVLRVN